LKNNTQHIDDLLVKHLTGEATEAEQSEVQQWLTLDDANRRYYDHFKLIWEESVHLAANTQVDENVAWERFQQFREQTVQRKANKKVKAGIFIVMNPVLKAAVIVGIVVGIAALTYYLFQNKPGQVIAMTTIQATEAVKSNALPDGSQIVLNRHSLVSYPSRFKGNKRVIQLNGEAFFQVTPDKEKPFVVHTNNVTITVVGTSFNVRSRGDTTEIIVETGIVQVAIDQQTVTLKAGEKVITRQKETSTVLEKQSTTDQLHSYYRRKKFECDNTPLWKLVEKLNEAYNVQIVIEGAELRNLPYTGTLDDESLDNILHLLHESLDIAVVREQGQIILR
jgi:ferric-dicitrate binding protein FerR (iron transport regulator)